MSRRYPPEFPTEVLELLQNNYGDVARTSLETGVPERTIREWRRVALASGSLPPLPPSPPSPSKAAIPEFEDDAEALKFVRKQLIAELVNMSASLKDTLAVSAPYHRVLALTQLIDRLDKINAIIPKDPNQPFLRIQFLDAQGNEYNSLQEMPDDDRSYNPRDHYPSEYGRWPEEQADSETEYPRHAAEP